MKTITKDDKITITQVILLLTGLVLHIIYSLIAYPLLLDYLEWIEWRIANSLYSLPYIVCLIGCMFSRHRNPRKLSVYSIIAVSLSCLLAYGGQYVPLYEFSSEFSTVLYGAVIAVAAVFSLYFAIFISDINKYIFVFYYWFQSSFLVGVCIFSLYNNYMLALNIFPFALLLIAIGCYGFKFNSRNQYIPKHYKLMDLDNSKEIDFDYIVDSITDLYLTDELYLNAVEARDFYYAIKYNDTEKLSKLDITGRENIKSVFELWLKFEDEGHPFNKERTLFFGLCKYMISDKTSDEDFDDKFFLFCQTIRTGENKFGNIDIKLKSEGSVSVLSNLYDDPFTFDGITFSSAESFLQGLKFKDTEKQNRVFAMSGKAARKAGKHHNWYKLTGNLYYQGKKINRYSEDYDNLITIPFACRFYYNTDGKFRQALLDTELKTLEHSIGKTEKCKTILTQDEYLERLNEFKLKTFDEYYLNKNTMKEE